MTDLAERAMQGEFDDYESNWPLPKVMLIRELSHRGNWEFVNRITSGEFDNTTEEAKSWWNSREGKQAFGTFR